MTMLCSLTVQIHRNTLSVVWSQSGQKSSLAPQQCDQKRLVSLGWPLSKSAGCRGFRVVLQVPSERTQPVMDIERDDAIRHMAPFEKIKYEHLRIATSNAHSVVARLGITIDCFYIYHVTVLVT